MKNKLCAVLLALALASGGLGVSAMAFASPESGTPATTDASPAATEPQAASGHVELEIGKDLSGEDAITFN